MKKILIIIITILMLPFNIFAQDLQLAESAKSAIMLEVSTGTILFEKNSHEKLSPASMTKIMTMLLVVESIDAGIISWDEMVSVSSNASGMGGSQILLEENEKMKVSDLFKGVAVASGNDASVALAEKIAGTEEAFVAMMNKRVKELGLKDTNFKNVHGLDEANHYSSAYDMAMIAKELVKHPKVLEYTSIYEDYLRKGTKKEVWLVNTNKLVRFYDGVDGLKTGYTDIAGYCLTSTAKRGNMRLITVVMGEPDSKTRNKETSEMLDYTFAQYEVEVMLSKGAYLGKYEVVKGKDKYAKVVVKDDVTFLSKKIEKKNNVTYSIELDEMVAPIKFGDKVGSLSIIENDKVTRIIDLTIEKEIKKANIFELYIRYLKDIITGDISF